MTMSIAKCDLNMNKKSSIYDYYVKSFNEL